MKKVFTPEEWVKELKSTEPHWFLDFNNQDKLLYDLSVELFKIYDDVEYRDCLEEADEIIKTFYNYRYTPKTRKPKNG